MTEQHEASLAEASALDEPGMDMAELAATLRGHAALLLIGPLAAGLAALGATYLIAPTFSARTSFLPPQQAQSSTASALASLGSLAGLGSAAGAAGNLGERYLTLMQSVTVSDRLVDQFKLMDAYGTKFRVDARKELGNNVRLSLGKKDGLITVEVDDHSPQRAADIANQYVGELRRITGTLALTEAQQRRAFFERHLQQSREQLNTAQRSLEASGFNAGALKSEPKAAADAYARLKAEATAAEMKLGLLRNTLADGTPEVAQQQATVAALRQQLTRAERAAEVPGDADYITRYREFKYQETLFDLYARQFELARADESREGALIQVVDAATPPEKMTKPRRGTVTLLSTAASAVLLALWVLWRQGRRPRQTGGAEAGRTVNPASTLP
jgi:capsule polysaccharide export protein KpsE/RkpR